MRALVVALWLCVCAPLSAQTVKAIDTPDSLVRITKAGGTTFDSALVVWSYGGRVVRRVVPANASDTTRFARVTATAAQSDALTLSYFTYPKPKVTAATIAARVVAKPASAPLTAYVVPTLPDTFTAPYPAAQRVVRLSALADLQAALNGAQPGDEIVLPNGAVWTGNYVLPTHAPGWVVLRSESPPSAGSRIDTTAWSAATILTPNSEAAVRSAPGAFGWRLVGLKVGKPAGVATEDYGLIVLGRGDETTVAQQPRDIVLDRVWVSGNSVANTRRCVAFNGARLAVIDSWLSECHARGFDAQGVGGWAGSGPYLIAGNRIEASGQAIMFGGADPRIVGQSPSDIVIQRNYLFKPLSWARGVWTVKAAFELKHAKRVLFEGNVIENHWADAQVGFAILLQTLADQNTSWAWTTVQDVTIRNNWVRNATSGINLLARVAYNGGQAPTNPTARVLVANNLFEQTGRDPITNAAGINVQLLADLVDVTVTNNTFVGGPAQKALSFDGAPQVRTVLTDNVFTASSYPITGNATGPGNATLNVFMPGGVFLRNTLPGASVKDFGANALGNASGVGMGQLNAAMAGVVK